MTVTGPLLTASGVTVQRGTRVVLKDIDLAIERGEIVTLTGQNGSGKTTLLETIAGLHSLKKGRVKATYTNGNDIIIRDLKGRRTPAPGVSLALQSVGACLDESVIERLRTASSVAGIKIDDEALETEMEKWSVLHRANDRLAILSNGLRKRVSVLSALLPAMFSNHQRLILLDEPGDGMDDESKNILKSSIMMMKDSGHSIVIVTHDTSMVELSDRTVALSNGKITTSIQKSRKPSHVPLLDSYDDNSGIKEFCRWIVAIERRNPVDTIQRLVPALLALFLIRSVGLEDITNQNTYSLAFYLLIPALVSVMARPALIDRLSEERSGDWWRAHLGRSVRPYATILGGPWLLPLPLVYLSFAVISFNATQIDQSAQYWLWLPALALIDIGIAATAIQMLVSGLERSGAVAVSLMMIILIWPFMMTLEATALLLEEGFQYNLGFDTPLGLIILSSLISAGVWLSAVVLPDQ